MAATTRLAASSGGTRNRAGAKIAELSNLLSDSLTSLLDIGQRMRHGGGPPVLAYHIRKEYRSKKETPLHLTSVSRTLAGRAQTRSRGPVLSYSDGEYLSRV